ncbi:MAG TPA: hypothetical protein VFL82_00445, partial [Thermomicrobiales bacterium]|nr:hypothetical protein [Thermomicrobiales bacterium]
MSGIRFVNDLPLSWSRVAIAVLLSGSLVMANLLVLTPFPTAAAPATATISTPSPDECIVAPRSLPLPDGAATPTTPEAMAPEFVTPTGTPADNAVEQAVTVTVRESVACANAGDLLRGLALYTDR